MITLSLSPELEQKLARRAAASGQSVEALASRMLASAIDLPTVEEILAPVRQRFAQSGMTEEELVALLEAEKHAMREERRNRRAS